MSSAQMLRCSECQAYLRRRSSLLAMETVIVARRRGVSALHLAEAYMSAVHDRHLAGLPIGASS